MGEGRGGEGWGVSLQYVKKIYSTCSFNSIFLYLKYSLESVS